MFKTARYASAAALMALGLALPLAANTASATDSITLQSTTSTANSGLYDYLLPNFEANSGIKVNVVAVGTGQAIRNASNCDGDVLLVHARAAEEKFVESGFGVERFDLMFNDFVLVGPPADPAGIAGSNDITFALGKIAQTQALFASRGDDSGTHKKELALWNETGVEAADSSGKWYRETGSGMGATLNVGIGMGAYVMTDRATWVKFKNKQRHSIVVEGDNKLFNQYGVMLVNPAKCSNVNAKAGQALVDWLISVPGQKAIANYVVEGQQLFFPNAGKTTSQ